MISGIKILNGFATELPNFHEGIEFTFPEGLTIFSGSNGCLAEGTEILTTKGVKKIEEIVVGDEVFSEDGNPIKVLQTFNTGVKKVVELRSDQSVWVESTYDHVWLCGTKSYKDFKATRVLDFNKTVTRIKRLYNKADLGCISYNRAYLLGAMLGDGCCKSTTKFYDVSNTHESVVNRIAKDLDVEYKKLHDNNFTWRVLSNDKDDLYMKYCHDKYAHEKTIDLEIVKSWNRETLLNYVAGLVDTDGSLYTHRRSCVTFTISMQAKDVIDSVEYAFKALWGCVGIRHLDNREKYKNGPCHAFTLKRNKDVYKALQELKDYLQVDNKKNIINELKNYTYNDLYVGVSLGRERMVQTYDIHVDSDSNLYCLANGLVTHNSGKSSILKMLKAYCGIPNGYAGWSRISSELALGAQCKSHFPWVYRAYSPGQSDCIVGWDGTATFYNEGDVKIDQWAWFTHKEISSEDGMTTEEEHMDAMIEKPSSGQYRMKKLNKLFNMLKTPPDLTKYVSSHPAQVGEVDYIRSLPRTGRVTLLLDEPERALSLPKQMELFALLKKMSKDYQIIVATHSPFVCLMDLDAKIYDIEAGYSDECRNIIENLVNNNK